MGIGTTDYQLNQNQMTQAKMRKAIVLVIVLIILVPCAFMVYDSVAVSDHVITSRGMGCAIDFSLAIIEALCGKEAAEKLAEAIIYIK